MFSGNTKNNKINMNTFLEFLTLIWLVVLPALSLLFLFLYCCDKAKNEYKLLACSMMLNFLFLFLGTKVVDNYVKMKNDIKSCTEREGAYYQQYIELLESNSKINKNKIK